jgi:hypothetical protein
MDDFFINGHPDPFNDESPRGYMLRIVDLNGFKGVESICRKAGIKYAHKIHVMSRQWEHILGVFTPVLYKQESPLMNTFEHHWTAKVYAKFDMKMSNLFSVNCRVCPLCIKDDNGYANADWDFALTTVCTKHKCPLIDVCPNCNEPITWKRNELDQCPHCEKAYSSVPVSLLEKGHPILKLNKSYAMMNREEVEQVISACSRMNRPQDNMLSKPCLNLMSLNEINNLLSQALGLMHSLPFRTQYLQWLEDTRTDFGVISNEAVQEPFNAFIAAYTGKLNNSLGDITFVAPTGLLNRIDKQNIAKPISKSAELGIQAARLKNFKDEMEEVNLSSQISSSRLACVLGVPSASIKHMVDGGGLVPTNIVNTPSHCMFDLNDISSLVKNMPIQEHEENKHFISLNSLADGKLLSKFVLKFHHAIELILQQKIALYSGHDKKGFFNGTVCERDLINLLESMKIMTKKRLSVVEFSNVLNTSLQCVSELINAGVINESTIETPDEPQITSITKDSMQSFLSKYISANRISFLNGVRVDKTLRLLRDKGIAPKITINDGKTPLYLFQKSSDLRLAISSLPQKFS